MLSFSWTKYSTPSPYCLGLGLRRRLHASSMCVCVWCMCAQHASRYNTYTLQMYIRHKFPLVFGSQKWVRGRSHENTNKHTEYTYVHMIHLQTQKKNLAFTTNEVFCIFFCMHNKNILHFFCIHNKTSRYLAVCGERQRETHIHTHMHTHSYAHQERNGEGEVGSKSD